MTGTSSIDRALTSGGVTPDGIRSMLDASFWLSRTSASSSSWPTRNRTMTIDIPGLEVEYRYSTPGISQSSFSIGRVTRCSTSSGDAPGIATITSTIGTMICGSSSRGSATTATMPSASAATMKSGVSFESMKAAASRPAAPYGRLIGGLLRRRRPATAPRPGAGWSPRRRSA